MRIERNVRLISKTNYKTNIKISSKTNSEINPQISTRNHTQILTRTIRLLILTV